MLQQQQHIYEGTKKEHYQLMCGYVAFTLAYNLHTYPTTSNSINVEINILQTSIAFH